MAEIPFEPYTGQSKLRFWCQKVLPLVYDDSLSYYELLNKVVDYLNNTITDVSACEDNITALRDAFVQLQDYVNEVLDDFAPEVERVIDEMIDSGEFGEILADVVNGLIANGYITTQGYAQFDYVIKDGKLYCATESTSGEWDATKWRETTVGADMQLLNQRLYNLNAGQVAFNESTTYDNGTVGKKLKDLDDFDDNLNAGQVAFNESTTYDNGTVGKKLKDLDDFDDNLNAGQVAFNENATYDNGTVGKKLKDLDDFDDNLNAGQVSYDESATYGNATVGKELKELKSSLNTEVTTRENADNAIESSIAIIVTGNTNNTGNTIEKDSYIYLKGHSTLTEGLYRTSAAIPANSAIAGSVSAVSGGLNDVKLTLSTSLQEYEITDTTFGFVDTGISQDQYIPFAYFVPFTTNTAVRFSNIASGGNIRFQLINCETNAVLTSGSYWVYIVWLHRSYLNRHGI